MADRLADLCARMRADFQRHLIPDGIVAGLAEFGPDGIDYFLHPRDRTTGVSYRLLPMTRGIISGMFTLEQARRHADLIERHLLFPDGARLMDRPMDYHGGTSRIFKRAESAASFGETASAASQRSGAAISADARASLTARGVLWFMESPGSV